MLASLAFGIGTLMADWPMPPGITTCTNNTNPAPAGQWLAQGSMESDGRVFVLAGPPVKAPAPPLKGGAPHRWPIACVANFVGTMPLYTASGSDTLFVYGQVTWLPVRHHVPTHRATPVDTWQ
jgi:hypothetical protein